MALMCFALVLESCKKETLKPSDCDALKRDLIAKDVHGVIDVLGNLLIIHSRENLDKLAVTVSEQCNITASKLCFNCIYTEPAQSEIKFSFSHSGTTVERVIDISYNKENKMKIVGVHD